MRERRQVPGGPDRTLRRHARVETGVDQPLEEAGELGAHSREALHEARELEHEREAHDGIVEQRPDAGAVREDDVALQERALRGRDARLREQAEAGVDAVGGRVAGGEPRGRRVRLGDGAQRGRIDGRRVTGAAIDAAQVGEVQRPGAELQGVGVRPSQYLARAHHGAARVKANPVTEFLERVHVPDDEVRGEARRERCRARRPRPSARAAWRVTPSSASSAVSPKSRVAMLSAEQQRGARGGAGVAVARHRDAPAPAARSAAIGGLCVSARQ